MSSSPAGPRLALALLVAGVGACGPDSPDELTAEQYRERINRSCRDAERDARRLQGSGVRAQLEGALAAAERSQEQLERTEPPDELRERHDEAVRVGREGIGLLRKAVEIVDREDPPEREAFELLVDSRRVVREGNAAARSLGLGDCVAEGV